MFFNSYKEYQDYWLSLIFRMFQEFPIHPIQVIYLAEIYLNRNNPNDTRKALYWLEILDKLERPRYEDLFGMTDRLSFRDADDEFLECRKEKGKLDVLYEITGSKS